MALTRLDSFSKKPADMPDVPSPSMTPDDIRALWETPLDEILENIQGIADDINSTTSGASGADNVGATNWDGSPSTVGALLSWLKANKTDLTGDHKGTWQGYTPSKADPGISSVVDQHTSQLADIMSRKFYARDYGVKLDGVTDDTAALNTFFKNYFGQGELILNDGVALVTGQLNIPGLWTPNTGNSSVKKLTFDRASIKYMGPSNKAVMQVYNHYTSIIDGVAITRDSNPTYINFAGFWYSKFANFDVPKITFGYNNADISDTLDSAASFTNVIEKGYVSGDLEFYGTGVTGSSVINSMRIKDVLVDGKNTNPYNVKFYGTGFQNFAFEGCDLSYSTTSVLYVDVTQTTCSLHFEDCYFDTPIPLIENYNFKGAMVSVGYSEQSAGNTNQFSFVTTSNLMMNSRIGNRGYEPNILPKGLYNYMYNGDLSYNVASGSWLTVTNTGGGSNPATSWKTNTNTLSGNALNVVFSANSQQLLFSGVPVPQTGTYTCGLRLIKNSGDALVQISFGGAYYTFDLSKIANGTEVVLSSHANFNQITQGTIARFSLTTQTINTGANIDILEVFLIEGTYTGINLPLHPKAKIYNAIPTTSRPTNPIVGQSAYDTTLNKPIWCKSVNPNVWVDATGSTV